MLNDLLSLPLRKSTGSMLVVVSSKLVALPPLLHGWCIPAGCTLSKAGKSTTYPSALDLPYIVKTDNFKKRIPPVATKVTSCPNGILKFTAAALHQKRKSHLIPIILNYFLMGLF